MSTFIYCLVDPEGTVHTVPGATAFEHVAHGAGITEEACQHYRFDLATRRVLVDGATPPGALAVQDYLNQRFGSPERLMATAEQGELSKSTLADLLSTGARPTYLSACTAIERQLTEACTAERDPCLASGCSVEGEGEICLQPLMRAGREYDRACAAEWIKLFRMRSNRIDAWKS